MYLCIPAIIHDLKQTAYSFTMMPSSLYLQNAISNEAENIKTKKLNKKL